MPDDVREAIEKKLNGGWVFDPKLWAESEARHARWDMKKVFAQFDADGDGYLSISEIKRAFHAIGLEKRSGAKGAMDEQMYKAFDVNGDGKITPEEFSDNLLPDTRAKIEEALDKGFVFDPAKWAASAERHAHWDMGKVFSQFDAECVARCLDPGAPSLAGLSPCAPC